MRSGSYERQTTPPSPPPLWLTNWCEEGEGSKPDVHASIPAPSVCSQGQPAAAARPSVPSPFPSFSFLAGSRIPSTTRNAHGAATTKSVTKGFGLDRIHNLQAETCRSPFHLHGSHSVDMNSLITQLARGSLVFDYAPHPHPAPFVLVPCLKPSPLPWEHLRLEVGGILFSTGPSLSSSPPPQLPSSVARPSAASA